MKKIIVLLLLMISIAGIGQGNRVKPRLKLIKLGDNYYLVQDLAPITGYTKINMRYEWIAGAMDSGFHVPQYNGVPSGVRSGVWTASGAIAVDTSNHRLYFYSGGSWRYSDASTSGGSPYTFTTPLINTSGTISINGLAGYGSGGQLIRSTGSALEYFTPTYLSSSTGWSLSGNSITAGVDFIGTTNNAAMGFRTNNTEVFRLDSLGARAYLYGGLNPLFSIKQNTSSQEWQLRLGIGTGASNGGFNIYDATNSKIRLFINNSNGNVAIGNVSTIPTVSQLYVFGGASGGNIDARGDSTVADESNIEAEHSDYDGVSRTGYGLAMRVWGNVGVGTTAMGYVKKNMSLLDFTNEMNLIRTLTNRSLRFGTNNVERMVLDSNGRLGIATTAPTALLHVNGASGIRYVDGNQGAGKFLQSDANGVASWQTVAAGVTGSGTNNQLAVFTGSGTIGSYASMSYVDGLYPNLYIGGAGYNPMTVNLRDLDGSYGQMGVDGGIYLKSNGTYPTTSFYVGGSLGGQIRRVSSTYNQVDLNGLVQVNGTTILSNTVGCVNLNRTMPYAASGSNLHGYTDGTIFLQGNSAFNSFGSFVSIGNNRTNQDHYAAFQNVYSKDSSNSVQKIYGFVNAVSTITGGNVDTVYGYYNFNPTVSGGATVGGHYGVYVPLTTGATRNVSGYFGGSVGIGTASPTTKLHVSGRMAATQGADVASAAGAISLGTDGNLFEITGTNSITLISNVGWINGSEVTLMFTSTATLVNGTATSGTDVTMLLAGAANFVATANDVITLVYGEIGGVVAWREKSRSVN